MQNAGQTIELTIELTIGQTTTFTSLGQVRTGYIMLTMLLLALGLTFSHNALADNDLISEQTILMPWEQPDVLAAGAALALTVEQQPLFKAAIAELVTTQVKATNRILKRHNSTHLRRSIKSATKRAFKRTQADVAHFLSDTQQASYALYSDRLQAHLTQAAFVRGNLMANSLANAYALPQPVALKQCH